MDSNARPTIRQDVLHVLNVVFPVALGNFVEYFPVCVGMALVGHNGDAQSTIELDAVALSRAYFCSVAMAPGFGVITALRTLCPQAVGAGQPRLCAVYLQRALLFVMLVSAIIMPLLLKADRVLLALGQPKEIVALTQPYIMRMALSYYGVVGMSAIQRVYQAHGWNYANLIIVLCVFSTAPPLQLLAAALEASSTTNDDERVPWDTDVAVVSASQNVSTDDVLQARVEWCSTLADCVLAASSALDDIICSESQRSASSSSGAQWCARAVRGCPAPSQ